MDPEAGLEPALRDLELAAASSRAGDEAFKRLSVRRCYTLFRYFNW